MKKCRNSLVVAALISMISGNVIWFCSGCATILSLPAAINRDKLNDLAIGMTRAEVLDVMGKPFKREAYTVGEGEHLEALFYQTDPSALSGHQLTPLVIRNDKLVG